MQKKITTNLHKILSDIQLEIPQISELDKRLFSLEYHIKMSFNLFLFELEHEVDRYVENTISSSRKAIMLYPNHIFTYHNLSSPKHQIVDIESYSKWNVGIEEKLIFYFYSKYQHYPTIKYEGFANLVRTIRNCSFHNSSNIFDELTTKNTIDNIIVAKGKVYSNTFDYSTGDVIQKESEKLKNIIPAVKGLLELVVNSNTSKEGKKVQYHFISYHIKKIDEDLLAVTKTINELKKNVILFGKNVFKETDFEDIDNKLMSLNYMKTLLILVFQKQSNIGNTDIKNIKFDILK